MLPGQAGLRTPGSATEIVLATRQGYEPDWKVASADAAAGVFAGNGGRVLAGPTDIPIRRRAIVEDRKHSALRSRLVQNTPFWSMSLRARKCRFYGSRTAGSQRRERLQHLRITHEFGIDGGRGLWQPP